MKSEFDAYYWTLMCPVIAVICVVVVGHDWISSGLLLGIGGAGALGAWGRTRHMALWGVGGLTAIAGALLALILESSMNGASEDPSLLPLILSFAGGAVVSGVLHHRVAKTQAVHEQGLLDRLEALPTIDDFRLLEAALAGLDDRQRTASRTWTEWWRSRPSR